MNDLMLLLAALGIFLSVIVVCGVILEWLDPLGERADAEQRNHPR